MSTRPVTLLTIEDEAPVRASITAYFTDSGFRVIEADSGRAGLELFRREKPDLVLTDLRMPGMDGISLVATLKNECPDTPVIVVSGTGVLADVIAAVRAGAWDYVTKPILEMAAMEMVVRNVLERARLLRENKSYQERLQILVAQRTEELRETSSYLEALFHAVGVPIIAWTPLGHITRFNPAFERLVGARADDVIGRHLDFLFPVDQREQALDLANAASRGLHWQSLELPVVDRNGATHRLLWNSTNIHRGDGSIEATIAQGTDITALREAEAQQRLLQEQLMQAQKLESIGRLAGGVAHDFNNLLAVILGYSELMQAQLAPTDAQLRTPIDEIRKAGERARNLTQQLLAFGRKQVLELRVLDVNQVIDGFKKLLLRLIGEDIVLTTTYAACPCTIRADVSQIEQVLMNLVINARDAVATGGRIEIATTRVQLDGTEARAGNSLPPGEYVRIAVTDNGAGIPREIQSRLFEPFFTTKDRGQGTGLGLATVYGIVKQHGGDVQVESSVGAGATFLVDLPFVAEAEMTPPAPPPAEVHPGHESILVVEDDDALRRLIEVILQRQGYVVLQTGDVQEAERIAAQSPTPALLLADVIMPTMTGPVLAERIRRIAPQMRVLFMSGYPEDAIAQHGVLEAGTSLLHKPFTTETLTRKIREVLGNS